MRRIAFLAVVILTLGLSLVAHAQDKVAHAALKSDVQGDFIRLVFSGADLPKAVVSESGSDSLDIVFAGPVEVSGTGPASGITPATSVSASGPATYTVKTGAMTRHRTLTLGNRLFVDIYPKAAPKVAVTGDTPKTADAQKPAPVKVATPAPSPILTPIADNAPAAGGDTPAGSGGAVAAAIAAAKAAASGVPVKKVEPPKAVEAAKDKIEDAKAKVQDKIAGAKPADVSTSLVSDNAATGHISKEEKPVVPVIAVHDTLPVISGPTPALPTPAAVMAASVPTAPNAPVNLTPVSTTTPHPFTGSAMITVGSTQGLALAAFIRSGYLWMVLSQEQLSVPPQVSGPDAAALGPVDLVKIDGGSAYRVKLPEGAYVRPEGAGLVWRLYITGQKQDLKSTTADRDFSDTAEGPQVHIPINSAVSALRLPDPMIGDDLAVITVGRAENRLINTDSYVDFDLLPAIVGVVVRPKADGIRISVLPTEVVIARQGGLRMSATGPRPAGGAAPAANSETKVADKPVAKDAPPTTIFAFKDWSLGGPKQFIDMRHSIDEKVATAPDDRKLPEIISGAKFLLAQGLPQEATGFLTMAVGFMPDLRSSADFQAINGAVAALKGDSDDAAQAFSTPGLESNDEIQLWKAFNLANAGKLPEAQKMIPANAQKILATYPPRLQTLLIPPLIEAILARGDVTIADGMLDMFDKASDLSLTMDRDSSIAYYRGRIASLRGDNDSAAEFYRQAADGLQGPYPVRGTLALVERGLSAKTIARDEAVRKLERFRYGWRGDNLESDILERLGLIYVTGGEQRRGLTILRDAATMSQDPAEREKLVAVMQKAFRELFSGKTKEQMSPLEAAAVAGEFNELMPAGSDGEAITLTIADQMVQVDLLERAANMIEPLVVTTPNAPEAIKYAQRAAAIRILNDQPDAALKILDKALSRPDAAGKPLGDVDTKRIALLRAKAKGQLKRTDDALAELQGLPEDPETLKLTADIAWGAQRWPVAADAFGKLIKAANLSATRTPTHEQGQLVLNEALALNLSGDTKKLDDLRVAYSDIMRRSDQNQAFQLVTRTAQESTLADRETLLKLVSEVDMFKEVLKAYETPPAAAPAKAVPAAAAPVKATNKPANDNAAKAEDKKAAPVTGAQAPTEPGQADNAAKAAQKN